LVVLSIAVGVLAIGMTASARLVLAREMNRTYLSSNPASAIMQTEALDEDLLAAVRRFPGVDEAEGRQVAVVRVRVGPDTWRTVELDALPHYEKAEVGRVSPEHGTWPPPDRAVVIERGSLDFLGVREGDSLLVELPSGRLRPLPVAGVAYDPLCLNASINAVGLGYVTTDTMEWLGYGRSMNELHIVVDGGLSDQGQIRDVANKVQTKIERTGRIVGYLYIPPPGKHPADGTVQAVLLVLGALGFLSLFLSGFLTFNTVSAVITQQVRQIGVMKAIGGRQNEIGHMYLGMVLVLGLLSLAIALPASLAGGQMVTRLMAGLLNLNIEGNPMPWQSLVLQLIAALAVPLMAALYPILGGMRVTVREALHVQGLFSARGKLGWTGGLFERVQWVSRPVLLSIRNTFRRRSRLVLTLATLSLAGALFMAVCSVRAALTLRMEEMFAFIGFDVEVWFEDYYPVGRVEHALKRVPGVGSVEMQVETTTKRVRPDGTESGSIPVVGLPAQTEIMDYTVLEGRWLEPQDQNAIVFTSDVRREDPDIAVGSEVTLKSRGRDTRWTVVGIVRSDALSIPPVPIGYANYPYLSQRVLRQPGRASEVVLVTDRHDPARQAEIAAAVEQEFKEAGVRVGSTRTATGLRGQVQTLFNAVIVLLFVMSLLLALVGGLGLMGSLSLNVLERRREIGVMRAIGASNAAVFGVISAEALWIAFLSSLLGVVLAIPLSAVLCSQVGIAFLSAPLSHVFPLQGVLLWLALALAIATVASLLPARGAVRLTVREVLAYE
jgi:putative ABC transport system permease protein